MEWAEPSILVSEFVGCCGRGFQIFLNASWKCSGDEARRARERPSSGP